jgi:hypothetical protein
LIDKNKRKKNSMNQKEKAQTYRFGSGSLSHLGLKKPRRAGLSTKASTLGLFFFLKKKKFLMGG